MKHAIMLLLVVILLAGCTSRLEGTPVFPPQGGTNITNDMSWNTSYVLLANGSYVRITNGSYVQVSNVSYILTSGARPFTGIVNFGGYNLSNIGSPVVGTDADTYNNVVAQNTSMKGYVDAQNQLNVLLSNGSYVKVTNTSYVQVSNTSYTLVTGTRAFTGSQSMGNFNLTNVVNVIGASDAANKSYSDAGLFTNGTYVKITNGSYVQVSNSSYRPQKCGATASVVNGTPIVHGFGTTPTFVIAVGNNQSQVVSVTSMVTLTFNVSVKYPPTVVDGVAETVYWCAG